ncbi:TerB family tellurite resistance protein [Myxococcota bacterium]|nr:TerB family tellurite resistance protein [Myxococcota bacterium]
MGRPTEFMNALRDPKGKPLQGTHPADAALRSLWVHVAFADGRVGDAELALFQAVSPGVSRDALLLLIAEDAAKPLDLGALAEALPDADDRQEAFMLASWMVGQDDRLHKAEAKLLAELMRELRL